MKKLHEKTWIWLMVISISLVLISCMCLIVLCNKQYIIFDVKYFFSDEVDKIDMSIFWVMISALATFFLGLVAIIQNNRANTMNKNLAEANTFLLSLQKDEYTPVVYISDFCGYHDNKSPKSLGHYDTMVSMMPNIEKDIVYPAIAYFIDKQTENLKWYVYEFNMAYIGKAKVKKIDIINIIFKNNENVVLEIDDIKQNSIPCSNLLNWEQRLILTLIYDKSNDITTILNTNNIVINIEMITINNQTHTEEIVVQKLHLKDAIKDIKGPNDTNITITGLDVFCGATCNVLELGGE